MNTFAIILLAFVVYLATKSKLSDYLNLAV
jgi:hypothetical protein